MRCSELRAFRHRLIVLAAAAASHPTPGPKPHTCLTEMKDLKMVVAEESEDLAYHEPPCSGRLG